jgi:RNA recognition motif-containing protein
MTSFQIHVGNLSQDTTDATLQQAFSPFGQLLDSIVMRDQETGHSRGFGFVTYSTREAAEDAIAHLHNQQLDGGRVSATLRLSFCGSCSRE